MSYIRKKSQAQEKRTAKEFRGRAQIASGAIENLKGDVRTGKRNTIGFNENDFLIENKFTDNDTYKLEKKTWEKIVKEALRDNMRIPLMQIDIQDLQLVVLDINDYATLFDEEFHMYTGRSHNESFPLKKVDLEKAGDRDVFNLLFSSNVGVYKQLDLVIMRKETFLDNVRQ